MPHFGRPHVGWPIYGPPVDSSAPNPRSMAPPPAPRIRRPIPSRLPPFSTDERIGNGRVFPACFVPPISNIIYDIRYPPPTLRSVPCSPFRITGYSDFESDEPFTPSRPASIRIISKEFPWTFEIHESTRGAGVTRREIISGLCDVLQTPLTDTDWGSDDMKERMVRVRKHRGFLDGGLTLKRVDLLGGRCKFQGFCKDEDFVAQTVS
ncbi:hypothetical protein DFH07DRAFT_321836 [Mycena maculata]|uniref:DUF6699 domain-containing protein n=1 Tax=Mycena maculata TaxID=230809 RepID=A0AAD7KD80_9AGAR|nr:hypothetical protein DFH07DRAFT_321836 [Mycena maculata]